MGGIDRTITVYDLSNPKAPQQLGERITGLSAKLTSLAFSPDGNTLVSTTSDGTVILWDVSNASATPQQKADVREFDGPIQASFHADGRTLAVGGRGGKIFFVDVSNPSTPVVLGEPLNAHSGDISSIIFASNGRILMSTANDQTIVFHRADTSRWAVHICNWVKGILTAEERARFAIPADNPSACAGYPR